jgi:hypothetical protein
LWRYLLGVYFSLFYSLTMRRESRSLAALHGAAFAEYAGRVPVFWPSLRAVKIGDDAQSFPGVSISAIENIAPRWARPARWHCCGW